MSVKRFKGYTIERQRSDGRWDVATVGKCNKQGKFRSDYSCIVHKDRMIFETLSESWDYIKQTSKFDGFEPYLTTTSSIYVQIELQGGGKCYVDLELIKKRFVQEDVLPSKIVSDLQSESVLPLMTPPQAMYRLDESIQDSQLSSGLFRCVDAQFDVLNSDYVYYLFESVVTSTEQDELRVKVILDVFDNTITIQVWTAHDPDDKMECSGYEVQDILDIILE